MSTRAQIQIEGNPIYIYKHGDGYPEGEHGILHVLEPFTKYFFAERRFHDPDYFLARLLMAFRDHERDYMAKGLRKTKSQIAQGRMVGKWELDYYSKVPVTGFGLDCNLHLDIEFLYRVSAKGEITIIKGEELQALIKETEGVTQ